MKIGKLVFMAMFAIGFGSSCASAQTTSSAQTTTATTATFTAAVAQVNLAAGTTTGTISLTQTLPKPTTVGDSPTATADYVASSVLLNLAKVGATVQATVQRINGMPALVALNGVVAMPQVAPAATNTSTLTPSLASNPAISNPARLTPSGAP